MKSMRDLYDAYESICNHSKIAKYLNDIQVSDFADRVQNEANRFSNNGWLQLSQIPKLFPDKQVESELQDQASELRRIIDSKQLDF